MFKRNLFKSNESPTDLARSEIEAHEALRQRKELHENLVIKAQALLAECLMLCSTHPVSRIGAGEVRIVHFKGESNVVIYYGGGHVVLNQNAIELKGEIINLNAPYYYSIETLNIFLKEVGDIEDLTFGDKNNQTHKAIGALATIGPQ